MTGRVETPTEIRPFNVEIPQKQLDDLRRRIEATRLPSKELVEDRSQGVQLATIVDGEPVGNLTRDHIVDNITLYWLTGTGASAARSYWEDGQALAQALASGQAPPEISLPVGFTTFPGEIWRTPRTWAEKAYPNLTYFNEVEKGGHFAAWEEPQLFAEEMRAAFRSLRNGGSS
jgi:pimeloyl-ACP methyl ester carboxylesterase